jgi:hypothetical protein
LYQIGQWLYRSIVLQGTLDALLHHSHHAGILREMTCACITVYTAAAFHTNAEVHSILPNWCRAPTTAALALIVWQVLLTAALHVQLHSNIRTPTWPACCAVKLAQLTAKRGAAGASSPSSPPYPASSSSPSAVSLSAPPTDRQTDRQADKHVQLQL